ncbi:hypothetical protein GCM10027280_22850 [Micromonospora polyrhachis]
MVARAATSVLAANPVRRLGPRLRLRTGPAATAGAEAQNLILRALCHELRTPITALQSLTRALIDQPARLGAADQRALLQLVRAQAVHLDGVWRGAVAQATGTVTDGRTLPLRQVLPAVTATGPPGRIRVRISRAAGNRPVAVPRIRQVLGNLVENALRHGPPEGRVRISASIRQGDLVLVVTDEGNSSGLLRAALRRPTPPPGVSGLGLWIVHRLVVAEGGSVDAYAIRPSGTAVEVVLPGGPHEPVAGNWPRRVGGWPRWVGRKGMEPVSAIRDRGGHRVQPYQGPAVRGQAGRP